MKNIPEVIPDLKEVTIKEPLSIEQALDHTQKRNRRKLAGEKEKAGYVLIHRSKFDDVRELKSAVGLYLYMREYVSRTGTYAGLAQEYYSKNLLVFAQTHEYIASKLGVSVRTVRYWLKSLREQGFIIKIDTHPIPVGNRESIADVYALGSWDSTFIQETGVETKRYTESFFIDPPLEE